MPDVRLPDGAVKHFDAPVSVLAVAQSIGPGLAKAALAAKVNGQLVDTSYVIARDADLAIVTDRDPEGLEVLRHSTAHLLAYAVKQLFPDAQVTIGPVIEDGFYYDFSFKRPFTPEDLAAIEAKMAELASRDEPVVRKLMARDDAVRYFESIGEHYKAEIIASIPGRRADFALQRRRLHRSMPRPARAVDGQAQGVQAHQARRGLLARRFAQRDAAANLRHGVGEEGGSRRLPASPRGGREARSPQAGPPARPVPPAGRGAGNGVLAPEGLDDLAAGRADHAQGLPGQRLSGSARPDDPRPQPVETLRALGQLQGEHVLHRIGETRLRGQTDELPRARHDLQLRPAQLSRSAAALRRVRLLPPQ